MEKDRLVWEYIKSRKWYLESELKRCRKTLDEFNEHSDMYSGVMIGKLEGQIDAYVTELVALKGLWTKLHDIESAENGWYQGRWEEDEEE